MKGGKALAIPLAMYISAVKETLVDLRHNFARGLDNYEHMLITFYWRLKGTPGPFWEEYGLGVAEGGNVMERPGGMRFGAGPGGFCVCPKCGYRKPHQAGVRCMDEKCPQCGSAMVREGSYHHRMIEERKKEGE
ncbi:MAG: hypothetical protein ACUVTO_06885 [Candidatus Caldatribacteriaceae bacterium]